MQNDKDEVKQNSAEEGKQQEPLLVHNPLDPNDTRKISLEDVDNEQKYKEALTERD